jgi:RND family efflux transporter MFP subunit
MTHVRMSHSIKTVGAALIAAVALAGACASLARADSSSSSAIEAVTKPSDDRSLAFVHPGRMGDVFVKEGDRVSKDQILCRQDISEETSELKQAQMQAADDTRVAAQDATLQQKKSDLEKTEWSAKQKAATQFELEHAKLDVTIADLSLKLAQFEHTVDKEKAEQAQAHIDQMTINAPFDGIVETIEARGGEATEENTKVIRVVNIDKLWVDVACPTALARTVDRKAPLSVTFPDKSTMTGKIILVGAVADAASDTLLVRVELDNTAVRPAGEHVVVSFPDTHVASGTPNADLHAEARQ